MKKRRTNKMKKILIGIIGSLLFTCVIFGEGKTEVSESKEKPKKENIKTSTEYRFSLKSLELP